MVVAAIALRGGAHSKFGVIAEFRDCARGAGPVGSCGSPLTSFPDEAALQNRRALESPRFLDANYANRSFASTGRCILSGVHKPIELWVWAEMEQDAQRVAPMVASSGRSVRNTCHAV